MHSDEDDAESEHSRRRARTIRSLSPAAGADPFDQLLYRIEGTLDAAAFIACVGEILQRQPRSETFANPVICQGVDIATEDDFTRHAVERAAQDARTLREQQAGLPFQMRLLRHSADLHVFTAAFARTSAGVSVRRDFGEELWRRYDARVSGGARSAADAYISGRGAALPAEPTPSPRHRPTAGGTSMLEIRFRLSGEPLRRMRESARRSATNEFVWSQCAFADAVFAYCPADAIVIWTCGGSMSLGAHGGQETAPTALPLVIARADSPARLVPAVTREWLSLLRSRGAERRLEPLPARGLPRAPAGPGAVGTLRAGYVNHAQEQPGRNSSRSAMLPGGAATGRREPSGVYMLVQSWAEHIGVALTFNTSWIAESSARSLAHAIEESLRTWTEFAGEQR